MNNKTILNINIEFLFCLFFLLGCAIVGFSAFAWHPLLNLAVGMTIVYMAIESVREKKHRIRVFFPILAILAAAIIIEKPPSITASTMFSAIIFALISLAANKAISK